jgi:glycerophosphoryl diester phosphodiesterase
MHPFLALEHPLRLAHRGSRVLWPENTAVAFQGALDLGLRYIETDVQVTSDGVPVVFHDDTLQRTTNGVGRVGAWVWEDLRHLDAAWSFDAERGFPLRGTGVGISRLDDVLTTWPEAYFNLDLKAPGSEWAVAEVVRRTGRQESVLIASFSDRRIARFRRITKGVVATSSGPATAGRALLASRLGRPAPTCRYPPASSTRCTLPAPRCTCGRSTRSATCAGCSPSGSTGSSPTVPTG